ncbi:exonuclease domain-containing protein [Flammeovirga agarivorans]|uniref:DNA polymerase III n=1 Tax=Flammeovirga agarivorans TaxID=2726742 RepID=A0A7X8SPG1_9BACT|nr:exonuclease domain-containing protein [Flammeovirga agarivorans]NLR93895.1 DNA polymerase III [Flammeovirga agarivorans]
MDFISIDFETANAKRTSACSIGIAVVEKGKIVDTQHHLIKPFPDYYAPNNVAIHGITPQMTLDAPTFEHVWFKLSPLLTKYPLIAHNAAFDLSVLRNSLALYDVAPPSIDYFCSLIMSRKAFPELSSYGLSALSDHFDIQLNHHNAESDAMAAAIVALKMIERHEVDSLYDLSDKLGTKIGQLKTDGSYQSFGNGRPEKKRKAYTFSAPKNPQPNHRFYKKHVVFTGRLSEMTRKNAMQKVVNIGGYVSPDSLTPQTDFLVLGRQDFERYGQGYKSSKIKSAEVYRSQGFPIFIMGENEFFMSFDD